MRGSISEVRRQLRRLLKQATRGRSRFVIFVDDLERCRPPRSVEVCEVAAQLLCHKDVVIVLIADMQTIASSAAIKYQAFEEVPSNSGLNSNGMAKFGRAYLQKIVQLQLDLPAPTLEQLQNMIRHPAGLETPSGSNEYDADAPRDNALSGGLTVLSSLLAVGGAASVVISDGGTVIVAVLIGGFLPVIKVAITTVKEFRNRRITERERKEVRSGIQADAATSGTKSLVREASEVLPKESRQRSKVDAKRIAYAAQQSESHFTASADALALQYLPPRPRVAKRLVNQLRLLITVAQGRGLFDDVDNSEDTARRLAKWCILCERWPDLSQAIQEDQSLLHDLERDVDGVKSTFARCCASTDWEEVKAVVQEEPLLSEDFGTVANLVGDPRKQDVTVPVDSGTLIAS